MVDIEVKKLEATAHLPEFQREGDVCADLRSIQSTDIGPGEFKIIRTGIAIELKRGWEAQVRPRSGLAAKFGILILNSPGTIDSGYRGEIAVILGNFSKKNFTITAGDRIAQIAIREVPYIRFIESSKRVVDFISSTSRGTEGLGSTGVT